MRIHTRRFFATAVLMVAALVAPLTFTASPAAAAAYRCLDTDYHNTGWFSLGDVTVRACWEWHYLGEGTAQWRPTAFYLDVANASKRVYVRIDTNTSNEPDFKYLGAKDGNASWGVPANFAWDMDSGRETTTTRVARRLPGRSEDCVARIRHDRSKVFLIDNPTIGSC